jgi:hypothetical protein
MTPPKPTPLSFNWTIVHADLDIAHVMTPLKDFRFVDADNTIPGTSFQIRHNKQAPELDCFCNVTLRWIGRDEPDFLEITGRQRLPSFDKGNPDTVLEYVHAIESITRYMAAKPRIARLRGTVTIPCHAEGFQMAPGARLAHKPQNIATPVEFYQFPDAVEGEQALLVFRAPLSPTCPTNGDGSAAGVGHS